MQFLAEYRPAVNNKKNIQKMDRPRDMYYCLFSDIVEDRGKEKKQRMEDC